MSSRIVSLLLLPILFSPLLFAGPPDQVLNEPMTEGVPELLLNAPPSESKKEGIARPGFPLTNRWRAYHRLDKRNRQLAGTIVDFTRNHGADNRFYSAALGKKRDMYVYLPPGYDPCQAYSMVLWLHGAFGDESSFLLCCQLHHLDELILKGEVPPMIVACPDGTYEGTAALTEQHSFYVNGLGGAFENYITDDVVPFVMGNFSVRPEREAHALGGVSAGGFGALSIAIKHRDFFSACAVLAGPINLRFASTTGRYFANFRPDTFIWRTEFNPRQVAGRFFLVVKLRAGRLVSGVFGPEDVLLDNVRANNPADLMLSTNLRPGDLAMYINYPTHDNFNFDAHAESFVWLANQRGIYPDVERISLARHLSRYFRRNHDNAYRWLGTQLLPPAPVVTAEGEQATESDDTLKLNVEP